jgi:hypothetical protein
MPKRRLVLLILAALMMIPAFLFATTDVFAEGQNCGSAIIRKNTSELTEDTGDIIENDSNAEQLSEECGRNILRQRFAMVVFLLIAIVLVVVAYRWKPDEPRFPGDSIV